MKLMDKARGTEFRSGMVSSWKRDPRFMDVLDTDGDDKVNIQGIFDGKGDTKSLKGEFVNTLKEDFDNSIKEPMAAAIAYGLEKKRRRRIKRVDLRYGWRHP